MAKKKATTQSTKSKEQSPEIEQSKDAQHVPSKPKETKYFLYGKEITVAHYQNLLKSGTTFNDGDLVVE